MKIILVGIFLFLNSFIFSQATAATATISTKDKLEKAVLVKNIVTTIPATSTIISTEFTYMLKGKLCTKEMYNDSLPAELKNVTSGKIYLDIKVKDANNKGSYMTVAFKVE